MDNTTQVSNHTEVYLSQIPLLFDEYVQRLEDPDNIRRSTTFAGAMRHIYERLFRPTSNQLNNRATTIDTADIEGLDEIWGCYCKLCYGSGIRPTILRFCLMTGINADTLNTWKNGMYRNATPKHSEAVKKWLKECESSIYDAVLDNSVGAIFAAKACFGWRETAPVNPETESIPVHDSAEQIAARHATATLPERPHFDDD